MDDRTASSVGFVFAGLALAAALASWLRLERTAALVAVAVAAVAVAAFGLRRYGALGRRPGAALAAAGSVGVVAAGLLAAFRGDTAPVPLLAVLAGGAGGAFAYADWLGIERDALTAKAEATLRGVAIGALGIIAIIVYYALIDSIVRGLLQGGIGVSLSTVLQTLASGAGTLTVVGLYLALSERDLSYIDVRAPGLRGFAYAGGGALAILCGNLAIGLAFQRYGVESASHSIIRTAETDPTVLLVLVPLSYLVIAPGEELLYRNVVQKTLRETFSPVAGVVVASVIFAAVHLFSYLDSNLLATMNTLIIIFVLALILGAIYERTRNVVIPIIAHGTFNAVAFAITYAQLTGALGG